MSLSFTLLFVGLMLFWEWEDSLFLVWPVMLFRLSSLMDDLGVWSVLKNDEVAFALNGDLLLPMGWM